MRAAYANFWLPKQPQCQAVVGWILDRIGPKSGAYNPGHGHVIWPDRFSLMAGIRNICCLCGNGHRNRNRNRRNSHGFWPDIDSRAARGVLRNQFWTGFRAPQTSDFRSHIFILYICHIWQNILHTRAFDRIPCQHLYANLTENLDAINILHM